jgi:hypothetical protein
MPQQHQLTIDFSRAEQLGFLRDVQFTATAAADGIRVKPLLLKAILRSIDDHGRGRTCYVNQATLAAEANCSLHQTKRAVAALASLGVLAIVRKQNPAGTVCNHYTIVWSELAVRCQLATSHRPPADKQPVIHTDQSSLEGTSLDPDQSSFPADRSSFLSDQSSFKGTFKGSAQGSALRTAAPYPQHPNEDQDTAAAAIVALGFSGSVARELVAQSDQPDQLPAELDRLLAIARRNTKKLDRPHAAVVYRLRHGTWPADGIRDDEGEPDVTQKPPDPERLYNDIVWAGRRKRAPDEAIRRVLQTHLPQEFLTQQGW